MALTVGILAGAIFFPPAMLGMIALEQSGVGQSHELIIAVDGQRTRNVTDFEEAIGKAEAGALFVILTVACAALAARLLTGAARTVWAQVAALNLVAMAGYAFTRMFSTFIDNQDVGNWSEMLGLAALLVEGLLVLLSVRELRRPVP